jgi:hypothetical protein
MRRQRLGEGGWQQILQIAMPGRQLVLPIEQGIVLVEELEFCCRIVRRAGRDDRVGVPLQSDRIGESLCEL